MKIRLRSEARSRRSIKTPRIKVCRCLSVDPVGAAAARTRRASGTEGAEGPEVVEGTDTTGGDGQVKQLSTPKGRRSLSYFCTTAAVVLSNPPLSIHSESNSEHSPPIYLDIWLPFFDPSRLFSPEFLTQSTYAPANETIDGPRSPPNLPPHQSLPIPLSSLSCPPLARCLCYLPTLHSSPSIPVPQCPMPNAQYNPPTQLQLDNSTPLTLRTLRRSRLTRR